MTATMSRRPAGADGSRGASGPAGAGPAGSTSSSQRPPAPDRRPLLPAAEVALALVTVAATVSFWRLFDDWSFLPTLLFHAVAAHAVAVVTRRRGWSPAASGPLCLGVAALLVTWLHLWSTTAVGIPTGDTLGEAGRLLEEAWTTFGEVRAPAPVLPGFLITAAGAVWIGAWLSDVAAFRLWTPFEALIPSGTMFVFASLFAADQGRTRAAAVWIGACLLFVLVHRVARQQSSPAWIGSDVVAGTSWLLRAGAAAVAVAVVLGLLVAPHLPTVRSQALIDPLGAGAGDGSRTTISPLVEIHGRLTEQSDQLMFTVRPSDLTLRPYWRLTSLDLFDGSVWSSRGSFEGARGDLSGLAGLRDGTPVLDQEFLVSSLAAIWLPAAFEPRFVDAGDAPVRWEAFSSTLIVSTELDDSDGVSYRVRSAVPRLQPQDLVGDLPPLPEVAERGLVLPADFPQSVRDLAVAVTQNAPSPFDKAMALQEFFRSDQFTYSLDVPASHSSVAMEQFLFETRAGYCEQFAGTYAAMARAVGLPARVAVGFTPGQPADDDPGLLLVRGENAHAWPEVWIGDIGWVPFEPTPGRGSNVLESYTGTPEQQDTPGPSTEPTDPNATPAPPVDPAVTTTVPGGAVPAPTSTTLPPAGGDPEAEAPANAVLRWLALVALGVVALAVVVAGAGASVAGWRALRRARRWRAAVDAGDRVRAAWAAAVDHVGLLRMAPRRTETPGETGARFAAGVGDPAPRRLAALLARAEFSPDGADDADAEEAAALAAATKAAVHRATTRWERVLGAADPRRPDRRSRGPRPTGPRIQVRTT